MRPKRNSRFGLVFVLLLVPCCALVVLLPLGFSGRYDSCGADSAGLITSYLCAYALTGGKDPYN